MKQSQTKKKIEMSNLSFETNSLYLPDALYSSYTLNSTFVLFNVALGSILASLALFSLANAHLSVTNLWLSLMVGAILALAIIILLSSIHLVIDIVTERHLPGSPAQCP